MNKNSEKNILWTAPDSFLPKNLWDRLEDMGFKVKLGGSNSDAASTVEKVLPALWVGQINGNSKNELPRFKEIKSRHPELAIILITKKPDLEEAVHAIKIGISDYLSADISSERLWAAMEGALNTRTPVISNKPKGTGVKNRAGEPIAVHESMLKILKLAKKIAPTRSTILVRGESGTGKEVIARYVHNHSDRKTAPFIAVNCAALPENLLESELFGHEKGAFTGAVSRKKGKFELASGGTLLLDEISEMAVSVQAKLLRVLQEREIDRVGGQQAIPVDTRIIATTNRDLETETKNGNFRLDLFYRLNVVPLHLPPLRERPDDIAPLASHFLKMHSNFNNVEEKELSSEAEKFLRSRSWPGNVRELENLMERTTLLVDSKCINNEDLNLIGMPVDSNGAEVAGGEQEVVPLKDMEKKMIYHALDRNQGNRTHAAKLLGISVRTLRNKLHEYQKDLETGQGEENI